MKTLVNTIRDHARTMFCNAETAIRTCDMNYTLFDVPLWKHVYHMLHSCDQWFINPKQYKHPDFHVAGLNSLDEKPGNCILSQEVLLSYLGDIEKKTLDYIDALTDDMLYEKPEGCEHNRLSLVLGAIRHLNAHLGNINCTTIQETGRWPRVVGMDGLHGKNDGLWE